MIIHTCPYCTRTSISESVMLNHIQRRHGAVMSTATIDDTNVSYEE